MHEPEPGRLFVYGTLRKDGGAPPAVRRRLEGEADLPGVAWIRGRLFAAGGGRFPAAVRTGSDRRVTGELYRLRSPGRVLVGPIGWTEGGPAQSSSSAKTTPSSTNTS